MEGSERPEERVPVPPSKPIATRIAAVPGPGTHGAGDLVQMVKQRILAAQQATAAYRLQGAGAGQNPHRQPSPVSNSGAPGGLLASLRAWQPIDPLCTIPAEPGNSEGSRADLAQPRPLHMPLGDFSSTPSLRHEPRFAAATSLTAGKAAADATEEDTATDAEAPSAGT